MFAENYATQRPNAARVPVRRHGFHDGEGEYTSADVGNALAPAYYWRNWTPATYYCTHALSPIMFITDTWPEKVNAFIIRNAKDDTVAQRRPGISDAASMIALRMDNGAVAKLLQVRLRGHGGPTRIHCARGAMTDAGGQVNIIREQYHEKLRHPKNMVYSPEALNLDPQTAAAAARRAWRRRFLDDVLLDKALKQGSNRS